jgi:hypothetical protein
MGIVYVGPYADDVHADAYHEGYAARLWPDETITGSWGGEDGWTGHIGLVGACDCGWRSDRVHPPADFDSPEYEAAQRDFEVEHLDPLIEAARQRSWPDWARRTADRASYITTLVQQERLREARVVMDRLRDDVNARLSLLDQLSDEREAAAQRAEHALAPQQPDRSTDGLLPLPSTEPTAQQRSPRRGR